MQKGEGQRSVGSKDRVETKDGRTDGADYHANSSHHMTKTDADPRASISEKYTRIAITRSVNIHIRGT